MCQENVDQSSNPITLRLCMFHLFLPTSDRLKLGGAVWTAGGLEWDGGEDEFFELFNHG